MATYPNKSTEKFDKVEDFRLVLELRYPSGELFHRHDTSFQGYRYAMRAAHEKRAAEKYHYQG